MTSGHHHLTKTAKVRRVGQLASQMMVMMMMMMMMMMTLMTLMTLRAGKQATCKYGGMARDGRQQRRGSTPATEAYLRHPPRWR